MSRGEKYLDETPEEFRPKNPRNGGQKPASQRGKFDKSKIKKYATGEKCLTCETFLGIKGGYAGTGLCGPCCTGEASTIDEFCETW